MKKFSRLTAVLILAVLAVVLFSGCKNNGGLLPTDSASPSGSTPVTSATPGIPGWASPSGSPVETTPSITPSTTPSTSGGGTVITKAEYSFTLPEGFKDDGTGVYYAPDYPNDASNINVTTGSTDPDFASYTSASLEQLYEEVFSSTMGETVDIEMVGFTYTTVSGKTALRASMRYSLYGFEVYQMQCAVQTSSQIITFTYTQMMGQGWEQAFDASADSIVVY